MKKWVITTTTCSDTMYLAWQHPVWDDNGYFWTSKDILIECSRQYNTPDHPMLFENRTDAIKHLKTLGIPQKCRIITTDITYPVYTKDSIGTEKWYDKYGRLNRVKMNDGYDVWYNEFGGETRIVFPNYCTVYKDYYIGSNVLKSTCKEYYDGTQEYTFYDIYGSDLVTRSRISSWPERPEALEKCVVRSTTYEYNTDKKLVYTCETIETIDGKKITYTIYNPENGEKIGEITQ